MKTVFLALLFGVLTAWFVVELVVDGLNVWEWLAFAMLLAGLSGLARTMLGERKRTAPRAD